jgi:hypothetical protein
VNLRFYSLMFSLLMMSGVASAAQPESAMSQPVAGQYAVLNQRLADLKQQKQELERQKQELESQMPASSLSTQVYQDCKNACKKIYDVAKDLAQVTSGIVAVAAVIAVAICIAAAPHLTTPDYYRYRYGANWRQYWTLADQWLCHRNFPETGWWRCY